MIGPDGTVLEMYGVRSGGRESTIWQHSGYKIDVFRLKSRILGPQWGDWLYCSWPPKYEDFDLPFIESGQSHEEKCARLAVCRMRNAINSKYSVIHAIAAGLAFLIRPVQKECNRHGLHCSQAVSSAYRQAGLDPWPGGPDWATTPEHLTRSPVFEKIGPLEF